MHEYIVYMLRCADDSLYIGLTSDLPMRLYQHDTGVFSDCYTVKRRPVKLVYKATFSDVSEAISWERRVKRWTRKKKEALISGLFEDLPALSKNCIERSILTLIIHTKNVMVSTVEP